MCGIAAICGRQDEALVRRMMALQTHRGPDQEGLHHAASATLGHRRLSIVDLENGRQPLLSEDGTRAIIANGEIYNAPSLLDALGKRHRFRSRSDSESALHLYEELGLATPRHLEGMFSLVIADGRDFLALRDPLGIKPLYVGSSGGDLVFASEIKVLAGLAEEIRPFPPGYCYHSSFGFRPYRVLPERDPRRLSVKAGCRLVRETLEDAVVKRLMGDVPVGVFLSGGLDSSLIAALARRHVEELHSFSVGVEGSADLEAARRVARFLGTRHHEHVLSAEEVRAALPEILWHLESFDQDLVRSAIPCWFTARLAAGHVKVVLTGEGADELFAGYAYHRAIGNPVRLHRELHRLVRNLHHTNLQRVDRLTMAHSVEARVPFLDLGMVDLGLTVPPHLKIAPAADGEPVEKWLLRRSGEELLPPEIVWRRKEQFDEGSGTLRLLEEVLPGWMDEAEITAHARRHADAALRSREESLYHRLLMDSLPSPEPVLRNVARWAPGNAAGFV
ncbi:MAG: asparagine synthase B [Acidobacteriota bacterium]|jgi:asparagine synthase (glutamine-hydrolysing)